jgi:hypothetical protein
MTTFDNPFVVFVVALVAQWAAAYAGDLIRKRVRPFKQGERDDFDILRNTGLTLLGLIIGFSFAISFFLIADIDSPRGGVIRVTPHNLIAQQQTMKP